MMVLAYGDGRARYAVLRGHMVGKFFASGDAEVIATYELSPGEEADYAAMTAAHATAEAPAVFWQVSDA